MLLELLRSHIDLYSESAVYPDVDPRQREDDAQEVDFALDLYRVLRAAGPPMLPTDFAAYIGDNDTMLRCGARCMRLKRDRRRCR